MMIGGLCIVFCCGMVLGGFIREAYCDWRTSRYGDPKEDPRPPLPPRPVYTPGPSDIPHVSPSGIIKRRPKPTALQQRDEDSQREFLDILRNLRVPLSHESHDK